MKIIEVDMDWPVVLVAVGLFLLLMYVDCLI